MRVMCFEDEYGTLTIMDVSTEEKRQVAYALQFDIYKQRGIFDLFDFTAEEIRTTMRVLERMRMMASLEKLEDVMIEDRSPVSTILCCLREYLIVSGETEEMIARYRAVDLSSPQSKSDFIQHLTAKTKPFLRFTGELTEIEVIAPASVD